MTGTRLTRVHLNLSTAFRFIFHGGTADPNLRGRPSLSIRERRRFDRSVLSLKSCDGGRMERGFGVGRKGVLSSTCRPRNTQ